MPLPPGKHPVPAPMLSAIPAAGPDGGGAPAGPDRGGTTGLVGAADEGGTGDDGGVRFLAYHQLLPPLHA